MGKAEKVMRLILAGTSDSNISFSALCNLLRRFGFEVRIKGDNHIFTASLFLGGVGKMVVFV